MNAVRPVLLRLMLAGVVLGTLTGTAGAADVGVSRQPAKAMAQPLVDWTGLYFGAHAGFGGGRLAAATISAG